MARSDDPLTRYLSEIGKIPLLTPAEEIDLAKVVQSWLALKEELSSSGLAPTVAQRKQLRRGERACERMITANLRLVVVIAKRYYAMQRGGIVASGSTSELSQDVVDRFLSV